MFAEERRKWIEDQIRERGAVRIKELVAQFQVSVETIRRDLLELERQGVLKRVHGGALRGVQSREYHELPRRLEENSDAKAELAEYAAQFICEGDTIFIDCGSTAAVFADMVARRFSRLTVITNCLHVFERFCGKKEFTLYLCSGVYMREEKAFCGMWTVQMLRQFHASSAFLFPSAISLEYGVMDCDQEIYHVQQTMMTHADRIFFLADSGKFEKSGLLKLADVDQKCTFITDSGLDSKIADLYRENQVRLVMENGEGQR